MLNTAEYKIGKYLDSIIKKHIPSKFMVESTTSFLNRLQKFKFQPSDTLISFDVVSLFTNVPLKETINLIADRIYKSSSKPPFEKKVFIELMQLATSGLFLYKDKLFRQVDGVTMGSPLGPTLANFCLALFEEQLLEKSPSSSPLPALYLRYVDDIFCTFRSGVSHQDFLNQLNSLHPNLKFTAELGQSQLPFLDTCISLPNASSESFTSQVFRKPTFTGLLLNFSSLCPKKWKTGLILCLLNRAYCISSSWIIFHREVEYLKDLFKKNGYPGQLFDSCLNNFMNKKCSNSSSIKVSEDKVETLFFIPYIGYPSITFGRKIRELFKKYYAIDVRVVFTTFKVRNYFSLKCKTPLALQSNVVYKYNCLCDTSIAYIGKTSRHLVTRVREHGSSSSAISDHLNVCSTCKQNFSCSNFKILDSGKSKFDTTIIEALHIKYNRPSLNKQLFTQGSSFVLNIF